MNIMMCSYLVKLKVMMKMSEKKKTIFLTGNITKEELNVLERLVEKRYGSEVEIDKSPNLVIEDD